MVKARIVYSLQKYNTIYSTLSSKADSNSILSKSSRIFTIEVAKTTFLIGIIQT